jgi:hypothetical protein
MHKEIVNGGVDLVPDLKRYRCTLTMQDFAGIPPIFAYAYNKFQAYLNALAYFKKEFGIHASMDQIPKIEVIEASGDAKCICDCPGRV